MPESSRFSPSKARGQFSIQLDVTADLLPKLMVEARHQSNEAIKRGELGVAQRLDDLSSDLAEQYQTVLRHEIKEIDDSSDLTDAITQLTGINKKIETILEGTAQATKFLKTVASILGALKNVAGKSLG